MDVDHPGFKLELDVISNCKWTMTRHKDLLKSKHNEIKKANVPACHVLTLVTSLAVRIYKWF